MNIYTPTEADTHPGLVTVKATATATVMAPVKVPATSGVTALRFYLLHDVWLVADQST
jgi:hypothetical protein